MILPPIKALALDLGNVLVKVDHFRFCRRLGDLAGLTPEEVYATVFASNLEPGYDTGRLTSEEFYQRVTAHFGVDLPFSQFSAWWNDIFDPMERMADLVSRLATQYPLFLVSNTNALHFAYIKERFALLRHFQRYNRLPPSRMSLRGRQAPFCGGRPPPGTDSLAVHLTGNIYPRSEAARHFLTRLIIVELPPTPLFSLRYRPSFPKG